MHTRKIRTYDVDIELMSGYISFDCRSEEEGRRLVGRFSAETLPLNMFNIVSELGKIEEMIRYSDYGDLKITEGDELVITVPVGNGKKDIFVSLYAIAEETQLDQQPATKQKEMKEEREARKVSEKKPNEVGEYLSTLEVEMRMEDKKSQAVCLECGRANEEAAEIKATNEVLKANNNELEAVLTLEKICCKDYKKTNESLVRRLKELETERFELIRQHYGEQADKANELRNSEEMIQGLFAQNDDLSSIVAYMTKNQTSSANAGPPIMVSMNEGQVQWAQVPPSQVNSKIDKVLQKQFAKHDPSFLTGKGNQDNGFNLIKVKESENLKVNEEKMSEEMSYKIEAKSLRSILKKNQSEAHDKIKRIDYLQGKMHDQSCELLTLANEMKVLKDKNLKLESSQIAN